MRVLIIGGTGLTSTAITRLLVDRGDDVVLYNRGQTDAPIPEGLDQIHGEPTDYAVFEEQMDEAGGFDCVIDMVRFRPEDAQSAVRAFRGHIGQFVFCSTVDVYTKPADSYPVVESHSTEAPVGDYGQNKALCERILMEADGRGDFPVTIVRPAYTYGEGAGILHTFGWSTTFLDRVRKGRPIVVHGDGSSFWVACHRDDVGRAFVAAAGNPETFGKAYHVTGEEWMTWDQYVRDVARAIEAPEPDIVHVPTDVLTRLLPEQAAWCGINFQFNNIFDNTAARRDLNFRYTVPWVEGVRRTVAWLDEHDGIGDCADEPWHDRLIETWRAMVEELERRLASPEQ